MTSRAAFDAESWSAVVNAPVAAALAVVAASPGGYVKESLSLGRAYAEARESRPVGLLREVLSDAPSVRPERGSRPDEIREQGLAALRRAVAVLRDRAEPEEVEDYRGFVLWVADAVARAHKEGGFLGIGGTPVSEAEQAVLDDIAAALAA